jgi:ABC-type lipoprotein export system ATPase subunit
VTPAIVVRDAFRIFESQAGGTAALQGLTLAVEPGEIVVVLGPSGSGKTTLLRVVAGLDRLSAGSARVFGTAVGRLPSSAAAAFRAENVGLLDQHYARSLSADLTCRQSVSLQLDLLGRDPGESRHAAGELLARIGLADRAEERPGTLSGGEQQRVAVCVSVAHRPRLLLADEPAGELDAENAAAVYRLLGELVRDSGATALIVSHDGAAASIADRRLAPPPRSPLTAARQPASRDRPARERRDRPHPDRPAAAGG